MRAKLRYQRMYKGVMIDVSANTDKELHEKIRIKESRIDEGMVSSDTVEGWGKRWIEIYKKPDVSKIHYQDIKKKLEDNIFPKIGKLRLDKVKPIDIKEILSEVPYGDWYKIKLLQYTKSMFAAAVREGMITKNPCDAIKPPKTPDSTVHAITQEQRNILLKTAQNSVHGAYILTLLYTGIRPQEASALTWDDYDGNNIRINKALKRDGKIGETKTRKGVRTIPVPKQLSEILNGVEHKSEYIFPQISGRQMTQFQQESYFRTFRNEMMRNAGAIIFRNKIMVDESNDLVRSISEMTMYQLRHTYATDLCRAGVPMATAINLMGHSSSEMLIKVYADFTEDQRTQAKALLEQIYRN